MEDFALDVVSFALGLTIVIVLSVAIMRPALRKPPVRTRTRLVAVKPRPLPPPPAPVAVVTDAAAAGTGDGGGPAGGADGETVADAPAPGTLEMAEGETMEQFRERLKKMSPPKKQGISPDMIDMANSYDDKVAVTRMIANEDVSRVALVIKHMIQSDMNKGKDRDRK